MPRMTARTMAQLPDEVCRLLLLARLREAVRAARELYRRRKGEALHEFRVCLRRLRSLLRAYRPFLRGAIKKKQRARLRSLANSTGGARDAEVQLAWLSQQQSALDPSELAGFKWLKKRLRLRLRPWESRKAQVQARKLMDLASVLRHRLSRYEVELDGRRQRRPPVFGDAVAALILEHCAELRSRLGNVDLKRNETLHSARITSKRLRYLLEPLAPLSPEWPPLLAELKSLQEALGRANDLFLLAQTLQAERELVRSQSSVALAGLRRLSVRERSEERRVLASLAKDWLRGRAEQLTAQIATQAQALFAGDLLRNPS